MSEAARPAWAASEGLDFGERGGAASAGDPTNSTVHVYATNGVSGQAEVHILFLSQRNTRLRRHDRSEGRDFRRGAPRHCERSEALHHSTRHSLEALAALVA